MDLEPRPVSQHKIDPWLSRAHEDYLDWLENHHRTSPTPSIALRHPTPGLADPLFHSAFWLLIGIAMIGVIASIIFP